MKQCNKCDQPQRALGLCRVHYEEQRIKRPCKIENCGRPEKAKELCPMHYVRIKVHGNPFIEIKQGTVHGYHSHPMYRCWKDVKSRCNNPNNYAYKNYGGRGIKLSKEFHNPVKFIEYVIALPNYGVPKLTLDRINNNKGYIRNNLRWATRSVQRTNQRTREEMK